MPKQQCMPEICTPDLSQSEFMRTMFAQKNSGCFLGFWVTFWGPLTLGLLEEVNDIPRRVHKNPQPLMKEWDPLLEFPKWKNTVHCAQISQQSLGCGTHIS